MAQLVLAVLLRGVDDGPPVARDAGAPRELLAIREQAAPLRQQQVHHVQVFALGLRMAALRGEEMDVGVAAEPALGIHVAPALEPQHQLLLARRDRHGRSQRLVLKAARHVDEHLAARQPALARPVDIGVANPTEPDIATHVDVPGLHVAVHVGVMAVRLIGNAVGGAKVDAAGDRMPGLVVDHRGPHPVLAGVDQLQPHPRRCDNLLLLDLAPARPPKLLASLGHSDRRRGRGGDLDISWAAVRVQRFAPSGERIGEEGVRGLLGERIRERRHAAIDLDGQIERAGGVDRVGEHDLEGPCT